MKLEFLFVQPFVPRNQAQYRLPINVFNVVGSCFGFIFFVLLLSEKLFFYSAFSFHPYPGRMTPVPKLLSSKAVSQSKSK